MMMRREEEEEEEEEEAQCVADDYVHVFILSQQCIQVEREEIVPEVTLLCVCVCVCVCCCVVLF